MEAQKRNPAYIPFIFLVITAIMQLCTPEKIIHNKFSYKEHITNLTFSRYSIEGFAPTARLALKYRIVFKSEKCCPVISLETDRTVELNSHRDPIKQCYKEYLQNIVLSSQFYIYLNKWNPNSGCEIVKDHVVCKGTRHLHTGVKDNWLIDVGYECRNQQTLDIQIEMEFESTLPVKCEKLDCDYCRHTFGYNETSFPNTLGHANQRAANNLFQQALLANFGECYQHLMKFVCFSFFPRYEDSRQIVPCQQGCIDMVNACDYYLRVYNQPLYCGTYPDSLDPQVCYYEPVTCPIETDLEFGKVIQGGVQLHNTTEYECNEGFVIIGDKVRYCVYSGKWNGTRPYCANQTEGTIFGLYMEISLFIGAPTLFIILIFIIISIYCKHNLYILLKYHNCTLGNHFEPKDKQGSLFFTYSSQDSEQVQNCILPAMKSELPFWRVFTYQEDFVGGDKLLESIHRGIWESDAVIAYLTKSYSQSSWCRYEFTEGQTRCASDKQFKVIIILPEDTTLDVSTILEELPKPMRVWIKGRVYLTLGERMFWERLRKGLAEKG